MTVNRRAVNPGRAQPQQGIFPPRRDYSSLSIRDLIEARDAYHVYLSSLENVVATAIGRYYIQEDDWFAKNPPDHPRPPGVSKVSTPRTLSNSVIRPWSWPAVLVFVKKWSDAKSLGNDAVPRSLYLPDGRIIPTCVIEATPDERLPQDAMGPFNTTSVLGGGYACLREHQGRQNLGTISCLVKRGGTYYALTNRHVAGGDGEIVRAFVDGAYQPIGTSSAYAVDRELMSTLFPRWPGANVYLTLDAGLVRIDNVNDWTAQVFGIGEIGEVFNATDYSITLDLIGRPLRAFGGVSGASEGQICALFFRYGSMSGYEYDTDLLIGPRKDPKSSDPQPITQPGDSGTMWFYDAAADQIVEHHHDLENAHTVEEKGVQADRLRPIGMQWGGQRVLLPDGSSTAYVLGSFVSSVCRALNVEIVRDWSLGYEETWGKLGHFSIGWKACDQLSGNVKILMKANQANIGYSDTEINKGAKLKVDRTQFVPLADVPDYLWVVSSSHPNEPIQHFADIDIQDIHGGPTLLASCVADPNKLSASVWKGYFDGFAAQGVGPEEGALPFRVWQLWEAMVDFLKAGDLLHFVAAGGVMAHYVGDASQPLHCSYMHHGIPPMTAYQGRPYPYPRTSAEFKAFKDTAEAKIHSLYEETMLEVDTAAAMADVDLVLTSAAPLPSSITTGHDAGMAIIELMNRSQQRLAPLDIIRADDPSQMPSRRAKALWQTPSIRKATVASLADSVQVLAQLWAAAWKAGNGNAIAKSKLVACDQQQLNDVCRTEHGFVPSLSLNDMAASGAFEPTPGAPAVAAPATTPPRKRIARTRH
jgi:hypothetical protein